MVIRGGNSSVLSLIVRVWVEMVRLMVIIYFRQIQADNSWLWSWFARMLTFVPRLPGTSDLVKMTMVLLMLSLRYCVLYSYEFSGSLLLVTSMVAYVNGVRCWPELQYCAVHTKVYIHTYDYHNMSKSSCEVNIAMKQTTIASVHVWNASTTLH